jgi:hypothetical protein
VRPPRSPRSASSAIFRTSAILIPKSSETSSRVAGGPPAGGKRAVSTADSSSPSVRTATSTFDGAASGRSTGIERGESNSLFGSRNASREGSLGTSLMFAWDLELRGFREERFADLDLRSRLTLACVRRNDARCRRAIVRT